MCDFNIRQETDLVSYFTVWAVSVSNCDTLVGNRRFTGGSREVEAARENLSFQQDTRPEVFWRGSVFGVFLALTSSALNFDRRFPRRGGQYHRLL